MISKKPKAIVPKITPPRMTPINIKLRSKAVNESNKATRIGNLVPQPCIVCGKEQVEGHHSDYTKPLDTDWLCLKHHTLWHK